MAHHKHTVGCYLALACKRNDERLYPGVKAKQMVSTPRVPGNGNTIVVSDIELGVTGQ